MPDETRTRPDTEEAPPVGRSWRALYALVLAWLAVQVVLFYLFTRVFR